MADSAKQTRRQLTIKQGVVKRLAKEVETYKLEYEHQIKVVAESEKTIDADEWEAKNAKKVLKDCEQMIAPAQQRLEEAYEALKDLLDATEADAEIKQSDEYVSAKKVLEDVTPKVKA